MVKTTIETTGDLREFLTNTMLGIRNGDMSPEKGAAIVKAAQQVNESFYSEIKTKVVQKQFGGVVHELGKLPVGGG